MLLGVFDSPGGTQGNGRREEGRETGEREGGRVRGRFPLFTHATRYVLISKKSASASASPPVRAIKPCLQHCFKAIKTSSKYQRISRELLSLIML